MTRTGTSPPFPTAFDPGTIAFRLTSLVIDLQTHHHPSAEELVALLTPSHGTLTHLDLTISGEHWQCAAESLSLFASSITHLVLRHAWPDTELYGDFVRSLARLEHLEVLLGHWGRLEVDQHPGFDAADDVSDHNGNDHKKGKLDFVAFLCALPRETKVRKLTIGLAAPSSSGSSSWSILQNALLVPALASLQCVSCEPCAFNAQQVEAVENGKAVLDSLRARQVKVVFRLGAVHA